MFGGTLLLSFFYALLSGIVFYTPFGIPVQDQHAYFFTFLLIFLACLSSRVAKPLLKQLIFFSLPFVTIIAFLSKQIPTIFGVVLAGSILLVTERRNLFMLIRSIMVGALAVSILLLALYNTFGIDFELLKVYFYHLPAETGSARITRVISSNFLRTIIYMNHHWRLFFPFALVSMVFLGVLLFVCMRFTFARTRPYWKELSKRMENNLFPLFIAQFLLVICFLFVILTNNQRENGVPLIFISLGLTQIFVTAILNQDQYDNATLSFFRQRLVPCLMSFVLVGSSLWCAWNFDRQVNATRMVHDFIYQRNDNQNPKQEMHETLSFLIWGVPKKYSGTREDFLKITDYFQRNTGNFYLLGDSSILYALTGRPSVNPVLWFHPGQTLPHKGSTFFPSFEGRLMEALRKYHVRYIVLEETRVAPHISTWSGVNLEYFPALNELVQKKGCERKRFGPFTIIELMMPFDKNSSRNHK